MKRLKLAIIGKGNVATHLIKAFADKSDIEPYTVNPHTLDGITPDTDVCLIAVSDCAIDIVATHLAGKYPEITSGPTVVAHTSGSTSINVLKERFVNAGVFYPLQTFSKDKDLDYSNVPLFIEAENSQTLDTLDFVANSMGGKVSHTDSEQRIKIHIAAVFACNFVNHLYACADSLLKECGESLEILYPLIAETAAKAMTAPPVEVQTGPAVRRDDQVIADHLDALQGKYLSYIYETITESIQKNERN